MTSNSPISEQIELAWVDFADKNAAATYLEEMKTAMVSQWIGGLGFDGSMAAKERAVKSSDQYAEYIEKMVAARREANLARAKIEGLKALHQERISLEANQRLVAKI